MWQKALSHDGFCHICNAVAAKSCRQYVDELGFARVRGHVKHRPSLRDKCVSPVTVGVKRGTPRIVRTETVDLDDHPFGRPDEIDSISADALLRHKGQPGVAKPRSDMRCNCTRRCSKREGHYSLLPGGRRTRNPIRAAGHTNQRPTMHKLTKTALADRFEQLLRGQAPVLGRCDSG